MLIGGFGKDELYGGPGKDALIGCEICPDLGAYWNKPEWNGWGGPLPDYREDILVGGADSDFFLGEVYRWSDYFIYKPYPHPKDWVIIPIFWGDIWSHRIVLDKDKFEDFEYSDYTRDWAIPEYPLFNLYVIPGLKL